MSQHFTDGQQYTGLVSNICSVCTVYTIYIYTVVTHALIQRESAGIVPVHSSRRANAELTWMEEYSYQWIERVPQTWLEKPIQI